MDMQYSTVHTQTQCHAESTVDSAVCHLSTVLGVDSLKGWITALQHTRLSVPPVLQSDSSLQLITVVLHFLVLISHYSQFMSLQHWKDGVPHATAQAHHTSCM